MDYQCTIDLFLIGENVLYVVLKGIGSQMLISSEFLGTKSTQSALVSDSSLPYHKTDTRNEFMLNKNDTDPNTICCF